MRLLYTIFGLSYCFFWPEWLFLYVSTVRVDFVQIYMLLVIYAGILYYYPRRAFVLGLAVAATIALASVLIGGQIGKTIISIFASIGLGKIEEEAYEIYLFEKLLSIMIMIPFLTAVIVGLPFDRVLARLSKYRESLLGALTILSIRLIEHVVFTVFPAIWKQVCEGAFLKVSGITGFMRLAKGALPTIVIELIVSSFETMPHWIDEITAVEKKNG